MKPFEELYKKVKDYTLLSRQRLEVVYELAGAVEFIEGDVLELGVGKGGSSRFLCEIFENRRVHLFDTFTGIPNSRPEIDFHKNGEFRFPLQEVDEYLSDLSNRVIRQGIFADSFPEDSDEDSIESLCFAHFDADTYESCKDFLEVVYPKMSVGGIMLLDDFAWSNCFGVDLAVTEFYQEYQIPFIPLYLTNQCYLLKGF